MGLTRAALAYDALSLAEREHLDSLRAAWSMLADFCFSDLVLYLRDATLDDEWAAAIVEDEFDTEDPASDAVRPTARFVMSDHVRPSTSQTIYHEDITGQIRTAEQRPIVAEAFSSGTIIDGLVASAWLDEQVQVRCIPVRCGNRVIAVMAHESALSLQRPPGALETAYLAVFERFAAMMVSGAFPFTVDEVEGLRYRPRVGDGVLVVDADGLITCTLAKCDIGSDTVRSGRQRRGSPSGRDRRRDARRPRLPRRWDPSPHQFDVSRDGRDISIVLRVLPLLDG